MVDKAMMKLKWQLYDFAELSAMQLYNCMQLRQQVFMLEQNCLYPDLDGYDQTAKHLLGVKLGVDGQQELVAYLRILAAGVKYVEPSIGRIVISPDYRKLKLGHNLLKQGLLCTAQLYPEQVIRIQAQAHLKRFYELHGFQQKGVEYLEDNIPHVDMFRTPTIPF